MCNILYIVRVKLINTILLTLICTNIFFCSFTPPRLKEVKSVDKVIGFIPKKVNLDRLPYVQLTIQKDSLKGNLSQKRETIRQELMKYNLSQYELETFLRIANKESTYNEHAKNGYASGLFQIMPTTWNYNNCTGDIFYYKDNIKCAIQIYYRRGNFKDWTTF